MPTDIKVPAVGESITEGTISRWLKADGTAVRAEEPLFELETDKATTEVAATTSGVLRIAVPEGNTVAIGSVVGRIEESSSQPAKRDGVKQAGPGPGKEAKPDGKSAAPAPAPAPAAKGADEVLVSPAARRLAEEERVDVHQLTGSGPAGRITKEDILT